MRQSIRMIIMAVAAAGFIFSAIDPAQARWSNSGGGHSSSGSRNQPVTGYIMKHCKTAACEKKHPTGEYSIPLHKKKKE